MPGAFVETGGVELSNGKLRFVEGGLLTLLAQEGAACQCGFDSGEERACVFAINGDFFALLSGYRLRVAR
jgi:hypothetical protein